ncbi:MAG: M50 family metallopeptidase [Pirellulaceae bacterium]|nr:M50 family metallopeptidase [Pirellulaceae bacterium]
MKFHREILIASTLLGSWLGMQAVHELGHACGAWLTGGSVQKVVLHPLTISRTDLAENPSPLLVVWAGPLVGVLLPVPFWLVAAAVRMPGSFVLRFLAGFCLVANGLYIGLGSFGRIGDCGEMLRNGSPLWHLWLFGLITIPIGVWLWHGQGGEFGLGKSPKMVSPPIAYTTLGIVLTTVAVELIAGV